MTIEELLELEHHGWKSLCQGSGVDFYGQIMTADAVMVLAHGHVVDRDAVLESLNNALPWDRYEIRDERLIALTQDTAALVYTGRAFRAGEPEFHALMSSVYLRQNGDWHLVLYQQTPIPATNSSLR